MSRQGLTLSEKQILDWLRLIRTEGIGPRTFLSLLNHFGGAEQALENLPDLARKRSAPIPRIATLVEAETEWRALQRMGGRFVARGTTEYPTALATLESAPPLLSIIGPVRLDAKPLVSIVGSRNASTAGLKMTERLSMQLGGAGFGIVSGLARGIDTKAHQASLSTCAIAVVAGGLDKLYPEENRGLFEQLCAQGAVVSEMPMGWQPRGRDFPRRNRIVSGLSLGTVVVEAARKSGSLITARFANEQGRVVFAVPGSPFDLRSEGPNDLIREGARLVRNADDVLEELKPMLDQTFSPDLFADSANDPREAPLWDETDWLETGLAANMGPADPPFDGWEEPSPQTGLERLLTLLSNAPCDPDELARAAGMSAREINILLYDLEASNQIERTQSGKVVAKVDIKRGDEA